MAIKKELTLLDIIKAPAKIHEFTTPQLMQLKDQLRTLIPQDLLRPVPDSPARLAEKASRGRWIRSRHLSFISDALTELEEGKRERMLVSTPPRHGKSMLISQWFPFWALCRNPERRIILCSYEAEFAAEWGRRVRNLVIDYGEDYGISLDASTMAAHRWNLKQGGGMITAGAGGAITGKGADLLIIDDPIKNEEEASSETIREKLWNWWQTVALTRLEPGGKVVIVGTRWHQDDLIGRLVRDSEGDTGLKWDIIRLPAYAEEGDPLDRDVDAPLWPERIGKAKLESIRKGMSIYNWSALYQGRPTPQEGGAIKRVWWRYYHVAPADFDQVIQSWDLSFKDLKKSDYCVGQVWGRRGAEFYLLYQVRERMNAPEVISAIRNCWKLYPKAIGKLIEDKANGPAVIAMLQKEVPGLIPVKVKAAKDARLSAVLPLFEAGNVFVPHHTIAPWVVDLIEECAQFPFATYDDMVDATSQALNYLAPAGWRHVERAHSEALEPSPAKTTEELQRRTFHANIKKRLKEVDREYKHKDREERRFWLHKQW